ncbi:hypothetical protein CN227_26790, partial [Sinorhizobium meliloti]
LGIRGRLFLGIGGRDHFGIRGRIASEFASPRRKRRTSNHLPTKKTAANSKSRRTTSDHSP